MRWLGGDAWALEVASSDDGKTSLELVAGGKAKVVKSGLTVAHVLMYEPSTKLLTLSLGTSPSVYRFDPAKARPGARGVGARRHLRPDRARAARAGARRWRRAAAGHASRSHDGHWLADPARLDRVASRDCFTARSRAPMRRATPSAGRTPAITSSWRSSRRQAHRYAAGRWPGEPVAGAARRARRRDRRAGGHAARARRQALWAKPIAGASQALWLADGALAVISGGRHRAARRRTGAVTAARCGWRFGLSAKPHPPTPRVEPVCVALEPGRLARRRPRARGACPRRRRSRGSRRYRARRRAGRRSSITVRRPPPTIGAR